MHSQGRPTAKPLLISAVSMVLLTSPSIAAAIAGHNQATLNIYTDPAGAAVRIGADVLGGYQMNPVVIYVDVDGCVSKRVWAVWLSGAEKSTTLELCPGSVQTLRIERPQHPGRAKDEEFETS